MPFALIIFGTVFVIVGVRGTQTQFFTLLQGDFTGSGNFIYWIISIFVIGAVGYIPKLKGISDGFMVLVLLVLFISKGNPNGTGGGFFQQFNNAIKTTNTAPVTTTPAPATGIAP